MLSHLTMSCVHHVAWFEQALLVSMTVLEFKLIYLLFAQMLQVFL